MSMGRLRDKNRHVHTASRFVLYPSMILRSAFCGFGSSREGQGATSSKIPFLSTYLLSGTLLGVYFLWPNMDSCVSFRRVFEQKHWRQLLLPSLYTHSVYHLVYVLLTLSSIGRQMEPKYGHYNFGYLVISSACYVNLTHCVLAWFFSKYDDTYLQSLLPPSPKDSCYIGLTGALLTLKVLWHGANPQPEPQYDIASFRMAVPPWFGLFVEVAHLFIYTPRSWVMGHVAGVLIGLLLVNVPALG